ncbi:Syntaxin 8 [Carabus blaptoides fortunei]
MALVNLGNDSWFTEYESCDKLHGQIMEQLSMRSKEAKSSDQYTRLSAGIRLRLKQFNNELDQLRVKLNQEAKITAITYEEQERRVRQIEQLRSKGVQMQRQFESNEVIRTPAAVAAARIQLMGGVPVQDLGTADWGAADDDQLLDDAGNNTDDFSTASLRAEQQRMAQDQERGLEELSKIISRQKNIAETISTEVDLHNEIIDDLGNHIDRTDVRVVNETQQVATVSRKDRTCGYWVLIILLFLSIIAVAVV